MEQARTAGSPASAKTILGDSALLDIFRRSPAAQEAALEEEKRLTRLELGAELARVKADRARDLPKFEDATRRAGAALADFLPRYNALTQAVRATHLDYQVAYADFDGRIAALESELMRGSSPVIDDFVRKLAALHSDERQNPPTTMEPGQKTAAGFVFRSDLPSIEKRLSAIVAAIRTVETWRLELDQSDLQDRFDALVKNLPRGAGNLVEEVER